MFCIIWLGDATNKEGSTLSLTNISHVKINNTKAITWRPNTSNFRLFSFSHLFRYLWTEIPKIFIQ